MEIIADDVILLEVHYFSLRNISKQIEEKTSVSLVFHEP